MFCSKCGSPLLQGDPFCGKCGAAVSSTTVTSSGAAVQTAQSPAILTVPPPKPSTMGRDTTIIACLVVSVFAIVLFHGFAAFLAVCSIGISGFLLRSKTTSAKPKLIFAGSALILVLVVNGFEGWQETRDKARLVQIEKERAARAAEDSRKAQEAFEAMSSSEHLAKVKSSFIPPATPAQIAEGLKHLQAIPANTTEATEGAAFKKQFDVARKAQDEKSRKAWELSIKQQAAREAPVKRALRDALAKTLEDKMLDEGYNVTVTAIGQEHTTLHLKWILVSKVLAHKLSQDGEFFENARSLGFKRIEITDGYDETWYWTL
jgi:hypothetical protein